MINEEELDDLLEESLQTVEEGQAPPVLTVGLSEDAVELLSLLSLATAIRDTPLAILSATARARIAVASPQTNTKNTPRPAFSWGLGKNFAAAQTNTKNTPRPAFRWGRASGRNFAAAQTNTKNTPRPAFRWGWASGRNFASAVVLLFLLLAGTGAWWNGPFSAHAATLADVSGVVEIASANGSDWHAVSAGEIVRSGARIRTWGDGSVTLAFFEGSRSTFGPGSEISLERVDGRWGDVLQVELSQLAGSARYNIVPFHNNAAQFLVDTPSGSASVHGTVFAVMVDPFGQALFSVERGNVVVANKNKQVTLTAGQATRSKPDQAPQPATFQFNSNDTLTAVDGNSWDIAGVPFEITDETSITGDPQVGEPVIVEGRINDNGEWVADAITSVGETGSEFQLTGALKSIDAGIWNINEADVLTDETTEIGGDINIGDTVLVVYTVLDGGDWLAVKIVKLDAVNDGSEILCTGSNPQPMGETLAARYGVPYEEIMGWFCQGFGFGEVDLAYGMSPGSGLPVSDIFALRRQGLDWDEIKRQLGLATPTDTSTPDLKASETNTPISTDTLAPTNTPTSTDTLTPTNTPTPTDTLTPTDTPTPTESVTVTPDITIDAEPTGSE